MATVTIRKKDGKPGECDVPPFKVKKGEPLQFDFPGEPKAVIKFRGKSPFGDPPGVQIELGKARSATEQGKFEEDVTWPGPPPGVGAGGGDVG